MNTCFYVAWEKALPLWICVPSVSFRVWCMPISRPSHQTFLWSSPLASTFCYPRDNNFLLPTNENVCLLFVCIYSIMAHSFNEYLGISYVHINVEDKKNILLRKSCYLFAPWAQSLTEPKWYLKLSFHAEWISEWGDWIIMAPAFLNNTPKNVKK